MEEAPAPAPVSAPEAPPAPAAVASAPASEEAEVAELKEMIKRPANSPPRRKKRLPAKPMTERPAWNDSPLRGTPPALRGKVLDD